MTTFPELIKIDAEIRSMEAMLKSGELSARDVRHMKGRLADPLKKREEMVGGVQKKV